MNLPAAPDPTARRSAWCAPAWGITAVAAEHHDTCARRLASGLLTTPCVCPCHDKKGRP